MNKYISPTIEIKQAYCDDIITASSDEIVPAVTYEALPGVDTGDSKSAVFNVGLWM